MQIVVLAPHVDDETLGCGGTINKLAESGNEVSVYAFSLGQAKEKEFSIAALTLGVSAHCYDYQTRCFDAERQQILDSMLDIKAKVKPSIVFVPASSDCHQDHEVIHAESIRAFKHCTIYGYELPWNSLHFKNHCYSVLSSHHLHTKLQALKAYESQKEKLYFKDDCIKSLAHIRGLQINTNFAECFEVIRQVM